MSVEVNRHLFHIVSGTLLALLFYFNVMNTIHFVVLLVISILVFLLYSRYKIPVLHKAMLAMERKENLKRFPGIGAVFYLVGSTIAVWIYPKEIALAAIIILTWGDGVAGLVRAYQKKSGKTWLSTIVAIITGTIAAQFFVYLIPAFAATVVSMLLERADLQKLKLDDNLIIPIVAGLVLMIF